MSKLKLSALILGILTSILLFISSLVKIINALGCSDDFFRSSRIIICVILVLGSIIVFISSLFIKERPRLIGVIMLILGILFSLGFFLVNYITLCLCIENIVGVNLPPCCCGFQYIQFLGIFLLIIIVGILSLMAAKK